MGTVIVAGLFGMIERLWCTLSGLEKVGGVVVIVFGRRGVRRIDSKMA